MSSHAALKALVDEISSDRHVSAEEAFRIRQAVFPDGVVSAEEAEALMRLNARVSNSESAWNGAYEEALTDFVLGREGVVDAKMATWVMSTFTTHVVELDALLSILTRAEYTPPEFKTFLRAQLAAAVRGRALGEADVERVRLCLFAGDNSISEDEARWLFEIDADGDGRASATSWNDLFVKAQLCHLMGRQAPEDANAKRQRWLAPPEKFEPLSNLKSIFSAGFKGYLNALKQPSMRDGIEEYYEDANAKTEEDAHLTATERAWALSETRKDGKQTANEAALLAALGEIAGDRR